MQLSVNFHILSPLLVNVAPVLQLPWLLSDSLHVIFPFHLSIYVVFLLYGKMLKGGLNYHFSAVAGRARSPVAAVNQAVNTLRKVFVTCSNFATAVH